MSEHQDTSRNGSNGTSGPIHNVPPARRMLLLPHCLRPSQGCPGRMTSEGLQCFDCEDLDCQIRPIRRAAERAGYLRICVAPGGRMAVRCVAEAHPAAIVAVACAKELADGVAAVQALGWDGGTPEIVQIPLRRDGCVDTDVDVAAAIAVIES